MNQVGPSQKAYDYIVEQIRLKNWTPGQKIMPEMELCSTLDISRVSVRQALDQLSAVGLLVKKAWFRDLCGQAEGFFRHRFPDPPDSG